MWMSQMTTSVSSPAINLLNISLNGERYNKNYVNENINICDK